jgi:hypothetical protein
MPIVSEVEISLDLPSDQIRVVTMHPFVRMDEQPVEPFRWKSDAIPEQLERIEATLKLAQAEGEQPGAQFTVLPEYAIPGLRGIREIDSAVASVDWPNHSVLLGGVHGLDHHEFGDLLDEFDPNIGAADLGAAESKDKWMNCCMIWVKEADGHVRRFVQLKLRPSWVERNVQRRDMRTGGTVWLFKARYVVRDGTIPCRFLAMLCYDWVAEDRALTAWQQVLQELNGLWAGDDPKHLNWVFVLQHNPQPNHHAFLSNTANFLNRPGFAPAIQRTLCAVFHVNTAAAPNPCRKGRGGNSSFVFSRSARFDARICRPTIGLNSTRERGVNLLLRGARSRSHGGVADIRLQEIALDFARLTLSAA